MSKVRNIAFIGLMTAIMCILSPIVIPIGTGVGVTLGVLIIILMTYMFGIGKAFICYGIYLLIGIVGLPVFSGFQGGIGAFLGPSGGFIVGYAFIILSLGLLLRIKENRAFIIIGSIPGLIGCYLLGSLWYMYVADVTFWQSVMICVVPFVAFDGLKIVLVCMIGPSCKKRVK